MESEKKTIYLDHAATTAVDLKVLDAMLPYFRDSYGNASGIYGLGVDGKRAINKSRETIAGMLQCEPDEIIFTSGGTESDNLAVQGAAFAARLHGAGNHIITTAIEHPAVLNTCAYLKEQGFDVTYLPVDEQGLVEPSQVEANLRKDTILVSVMLANNEIGTLEPINEIAGITKKQGILLHTDAVQAFGQIPVNIKELQVDLLSASAHKLYGPKGIGLLYCRNKTSILPLHYGGRQEGGRRAGTENVPLIAGFGTAAELAFDSMEVRSSALMQLRNLFLQRILSEIPGSHSHGDLLKRLPGNINVAFDDVESTALLLMLSMKGICAASGSACSTGAKESSHVLRAIGCTEKEARETIRFSLGKENTIEEIDIVMQVLKECIENLRLIRGA